MNTVKLAINTKALMDEQPWSFDERCDDGTYSRTVYLGSVMALDPCGRYHHLLAPNHLTRRCRRFWESLERQLTRRGYELETGEDPTDIYAVQYEERIANDHERNADAANVSPQT